MRLTKFNEETGQYESIKKPKNYEELTEHRNAMLQRLGEFEDGASDVAEEIFAEIERFLVEKLSSINAFRKKGDSFYDGEIHALELLLYKNAELKKKYIGKDTNVTTNTEEGK